jgi:hypothetical protein
VLPPEVTVYVPLTVARIDLVVSLVGDHVLPVKTFEVRRTPPVPQMVVGPLAAMFSVFVIPVSLTSSILNCPELEFLENRILRFAVAGIEPTAVSRIQVVLLVGYVIANGE